MKTTQTIKTHFNFDKFAASFRKEIEEYGMLLNLIYEQQNCLINHNPISLLQATSKIEAQLPSNHMATADRHAFMQQLAEENHKEDMMLNEIPNYVPEQYQSLFKALVEEIISLRYRIKTKTQLQQKLLSQAQVINHSILQQILPNTQMYNKKGHRVITSVYKEIL